MNTSGRLGRADSSFHIVFRFVFPEHGRLDHSVLIKVKVTHGKHNYRRSLNIVAGLLVGGIDTDETLGVLIFFKC